MEKKKNKQLLPKQEPLFISFVNTPISKEYIEVVLRRIEDLFNEPNDKKSAVARREAIKEHHIEGFKLVQTKLRDHMDHITDHGKFAKDFGQWANFYLSALKEFKQETKNGIERFVRIGDQNGDWVSGIILYNFSLFCKYYGIEILKKCPVDGVFFTTKGKYSKYCSDRCKSLGKNQKSEEASR